MKRRIRITPWVEGESLVGLKLDGQGYRFKGVRFHRSEVTGNVSQLATYATECFECREPFEVMVSTEAETFWPNRRCKACSKPGVPVVNRSTRP